MYEKEKKDFHNGKTCLHSVLEMGSVMYKICQYDQS